MCQRLPRQNNQFRIVRHRIPVWVTVWPLAICRSVAPPFAMNASLLANIVRALLCSPKLALSEVVYIRHYLNCTISVVEHVNRRGSVETTSSKRTVSWRRKRRKWIQSKVEDDGPTCLTDTTGSPGSSFRDQEMANDTGPCSSSLRLPKN